MRLEEIDVMLRVKHVLYKSDVNNDFLLMIFY